MKTERLTADEILNRHREKCRMLPFEDKSHWTGRWTDEDVTSVMQAFAAQEVAAIEMPTEEEKCKAIDAYSTSKYDQYYDNEKAKHFEAGWDGFRSHMGGESK